VFRDGSSSSNKDSSSFSGKKIRSRGEEKEGIMTNSQLLEHRLFLGDLENCCTSNVLIIDRSIEIFSR